MSDSFLQFALSFPLKTRAEQDWCTKTMTTLVDLLECSADGDPDEKKQLAKELGDLGHVVMSEGWDFIDFEFSIAATEMHIHADESGTPELVAAFLQQYLEKFQPEGSLSFSWAFTCSKMRSGEFGGGAAFVTAKTITFIDTASWAEEQAAKIQTEPAPMMTART